MASIFNFNIGILGHVDSGKTSLAKALSTIASTAAFDKNPQSQERGITLDLGFSSFTIDMPKKLLDKDEFFKKYNKIQFTLVDCPGHASLIRTIIGGAQIIDLVLLVVDAQKGVQTQTAECLILAEITCPEKMILVLNKVDLYAENARQSSIEKISKKLRKTLENTSYKNCPIVPTSALQSPTTNQNPQIESLVETLIENVYIPKRNQSGPFLFAVDHCFGIKGQGTIMTGTVLSGSVKVNDSVEIPSLKEVKKVKSMQIFRQPVDKVGQGDRVGVCVTQFDSKLFERGLVCQPNLLHSTYAAVASVQRIAYFKSRIETKMKFHVSVGYETVMCRCKFFGCVQDPCNCVDDQLIIDQDFGYLDSINEKSDENESNENQSVTLNEFKCKHKYVLLEFDSPVLCPSNALYIASKLDTDIHANVCRLAFHGRLLQPYVDKNYSETCLPSLKIFKYKERRGAVERMTDEYSVIAHGLFKKETNIDVFVGLKVSLTTGENGCIEGNFGQSGKAKIRIYDGLKKETIEILQNKAESKKKGRKAGPVAAENAPVVNAGSSDSTASIGVVLRFKRYVFDPKKAMIQ